MKFIFALFLVALSTSTAYGDNSESEDPPVSLAEEYLDYLQGGGGGGGGEGGGCGGGSEDEGGEDQGLEGGAEGGEQGDLSTSAINLGAILLKNFKSAYDKLSAEDAKKKFRDFIPNVDSNKDGFIDIDEIKTWVFDQGKQSRDTLETSDLGWAGAQGTGSYSWDQILKDLKGPANQLAPFTAEDEAKEKEKFDAADENKDGSLSEHEYRAYSFPELFERMADYLHSATIKDFDKDKDGKVTAAEYDKVMENFEPEAQGENKFKKLDTNGDGNLSGDEELKKLVDDYGLLASLEEEAKYFMHKADSDQDGKISYDEATANYELFLSPQAEIDTTLPDGANLDPKEGKVKDEL